MRYCSIRLQMVTLFSISAVIGGCAAPGWDRQVSNWGEMRPVMREGQTESRVQLADVVKRPHAYGVGAVEGLHGEILIDDGRCCVASVRPDQTLDVIADAASTRATLLIVAHVAKWRAVPIEHAVPSEGVDQFVRDAARQAGLDVKQPFPFVIEGELHDLSAHVVNGYCPMNEGESDKSRVTRPYRFEAKSTRGKLIGFYAADAAGRLTHHGTETHIHVLVDAPQKFLGHVEGVSVGGGAILRLPLP